MLIRSCWEFLAPGARDESSVKRAQKREREGEKSVYLMEDDEKKMREDDKMIEAMAKEIYLKSGITMGRQKVEKQAMRDVPTPGRRINEEKTL